MPVHTGTNGCHLLPARQGGPLGHSSPAAPSHLQCANLAPEPLGGGNEKAFQGRKPSKARRPKAGALRHRDTRRRPCNAVVLPALEKKIARLTRELNEAREQQAATTEERANRFSTGEEPEIARLTRELKDALEQQTATSEVLRAISSSRQGSTKVGMEGRRHSDRLHKNWTLRSGPPRRLLAGAFTILKMPGRLEYFGGLRWGRSILHREEKPKGRRWVLAANCASDRDKTSILRVRSS
jgi:hypothetical protein